MHNFSDQCLDLARSLLGNNLQHINEDGTVTPAAGEEPRVDEPGHAALAISLELERTGEDVAVLIELRSLYLNGHGLARILLEFRFGIEGVDVRSSARHVAKYDALCLGF